MLDVFQNTALVSVLFHFIVGLPTRGTNDETMTARVPMSNSTGRISLVFSKTGGMGFKFKRS